MTGKREDEDAIFEVEALLRRQDDEIAEVMAGVASANAMIAQGRAELAAEAEESRADREAEEREARTGALGSSRRALQIRLDRDETTWIEVMSGRDEHQTAVDYREQVGTSFGLLVEQELETDPELREVLELMARNHDLYTPSVQLPDVQDSDVTPDGRPSPGPGPDRTGRGPESPFGTW